jgi:hypothetical protein
MNREYLRKQSKLYPDFTVGELRSAERRQVLLVGGPDYRRLCKAVRGLRCGVDRHLCPYCREEEVAYFKAEHPEAI